MIDDITKRVIQVREEEGLNQADFAKELNLSRSSISLIERGERPVTERTLNIISLKFGVNYDWLVTGEGEQRSESERSVYDMLAAEYDLDELYIEIIKQYMLLEPLERDVFKKFIKRIRGVD